MEIKFEQPIFDQSDRSALPPSINQSFQPSQPSKWGKRIAWIAVCLTIFTLGLVSLMFLRNSRSADPTSADVTVEIQGPSELDSGNEAKYVVVYQNNENADLLGLYMEVFYPSQFTFTSADPAPKGATGQSFDLPILRQGQQAEVNIRGKLTGKIDEEKEIRVRLHYRLSNFNSEFNVEGSFKTRILAPKLLFDISGPIEVVNGQDVTFSLNYSNVSGQEFKNVVATAIYPPGFKFNASNPPVSKNNNIWNIGTLPVGAVGKIDVKGSFTGDKNQEKIIEGQLGVEINNIFAPQIIASTAFKIVASSLTLVQNPTPADYTSLGRSVNFALNYGNYGSVGMSNVVIVMTLEGAAIDFTQLKADRAIVTGSTLTWKAATFSSLALLPPNQTGVINLTLPIKSSLSTNLKNQMIKTTAQIYSDQVTNPIRANDVEIKLSSDLNLSMNAHVVSGPDPLQAGQATVFQVTFILTSTSNDLDDVTLIGSIPLPDSAWKNVVVPDSEKDKVTFDANSSKIRWKVGAMSAFSGKFTPARSISFNLEVVPNTSDAVVLLKDVEATGTDTFISKPITSVKVNEFRTSDAD